MLFQRINRSDPEKVFLVVKAGEALLKSRPVCLHFDGTDDGLDAFTVDAEVDTGYTVGIADADIASGDYGLVQCYGFRSDVYTINGSTESNNSAGMYGLDSASSGHLKQISSSMGELTQLPNFMGAHSISLATTSAVRLTGIFIRCM
uniref:Uncharacterized protein n=1 Tax=viral metagenome TaxID=1070528 RepID=A0A6M3KZA6_9ZZZZ